METQAVESKQRKGGLGLTLINASQVRKLALECAKQERPAQHFERVGASFLERIDAAVRRVVRAEVVTHPSKGVTLR